MPSLIVTLMVGSMIIGVPLFLIALASENFLKRPS